MKTGTNFFLTLRRALAPFVRELLERNRFLRAVAVRLLSLYLKPEVLWDGHTVSVNTSDFGVAFELQASGGYEKETMEYCKRALKPGMTFVDVGANIGLFTLVAARAVGPEGHVYAFEPDSGNADLLEKNVRQNGYDNVKIIRKAVSDCSGSCTLFQSGFNPGDHRTYNVSKSRKAVLIESISLDEYFKFGTQIDMIKIDIEGSEESALKGMQRILNDNPHLQMIIECWPSELRAAGTDPLEIFQSLEKREFSLSFIDDAAGTIISLDATSCVSESEKKDVGNILCTRQ